MDPGGSYKSPFLIKFPEFSLHMDAHANQKRREKMMAVGQ